MLGGAGWPGGAAPDGRILGAMTGFLAPIFRSRDADHEPGGLLAWSEEGDDLTARRYLIRNAGPNRWELVRRGRVNGVHRLQSVARRIAEIDHREMLRRRDIAVWGTLAGAGLVASVWFVLMWGVAGFFGLVAAVFVAAAGTARMLAAVSRNAYDPYRRRDPWEERDWWNRHL